MFSGLVIGRGAPAAWSISNTRPWKLPCTSSDGQLKPSQVLADPEETLAACRETYRLTISGYSVDIDGEGESYYDQFAACCRLAKATKVVAITVPAAELGTPFNAEIERLQRLVAIASREGVLVGVKTEAGRMTQDPDTAVVLCDNVKGLGITLDPSHYIYGPHAGGNYEQVMKHAINVHLRDTTKDKLQVRVGQGDRIRPADHAVGQGALQPGPGREHRRDGGRRPGRRNAQDAAAAGEPVVTGRRSPKHTKRAPESRAFPENSQEPPESGELIENSANGPFYRGLRRRGL